MYYSCITYLAIKYVSPYMVIQFDGKVFKRGKRVFDRMSTAIATQNSVLKRCLTNFYAKEDNLQKMLSVINGESRISLRIVDWFVTNYAKEFWTAYEVPVSDGTTRRFKVFKEYKQMLNSYSKMRFDPFCRWERECIPYGSHSIQTTIGQMNFFKWALENKIVEYIQDNFDKIKDDMNSRNSTSKRKNGQGQSGVSGTSGTNQSASGTDGGAEQNVGNKTRKKRQELSICASKSIKKENVKITVRFL